MLFEMFFLAASQLSAGPAGMSEKAFFESCAETGKTCISTTVDALSFNTMRRGDVYLIRAHELLNGGEVAWHNGYLCSERENLKMSAAALDSALRKVVDIAMVVEVMETGRCMVLIKEKDIPLVVRSGGYVSIRYEHIDDSREIGNAEIIEIHPNVPQKVGIFAMDDLPLYFDSSIFEQGAARGVYKSGVFDILRSEEGGFIAFSSYGNFGEPARAFAKKLDQLLARDGGSEGTFSTGSGGMQAVHAVLGAIDKEVEYRYSDIEQGFMPSQTPRDVERQGASDCKGLVTLAIARLQALGIRAIPVLTGTQSRHPRSFRVPDFAWMNHVVVYVPELDIFLDPKSPSGGVVDGRSKLYGNLGVSGETGEFVVIR